MIRQFYLPASLCVMFCWAAAAHGQIIAHYPLDVINAGTTPDTTALNGDGTLNGGPTIAAGKIGNSFAFTGSTSQFVGFADPAFGTTAFSASVWLQPDTLNQDATIAQWTNAGPSPRSFLIRSNNGDVQSFVRSGGTQIGGTTAYPSESLSAADFNNIVITYDGQNLRTFLNGEESTTVNSFAGAGTVIGDGVAGTAAIGGRGSSEFTTTGQIDDVAFFSQTLSSGEAIALFNLADEAALNYDASQANELFEVFAGNQESTMIGDLTWTAASGLGGAAGDVVDLGDGSFFLNLDGTNGVQGSVVPEPTTIALWLLTGSLAGLFWWRRRRQL